jgi:hypothetical protein
MNPIPQQILDNLLKRTLEDPRIDGTSGAAFVAHGIMMDYLTERFGKTMEEDEIAEALNRRMYEILCQQLGVTPR